MNPLASRLPGVAVVLAACLASDGSEVVPPATPGQFKAKFDRECAEPEKPIKTAGIKFFLFFLCVFCVPLKGVLK